MTPLKGVFVHNIKASAQCSPFLGKRVNHVRLYRVARTPIRGQERQTLVCAYKKPRGRALSLAINSPST